MAASHVRQIQRAPGVTTHAGLACLNGAPGMHPDMSIKLFEQALDCVEGRAGLINQMLEVKHSPVGLSPSRMC